MNPADYLLTGLAALITLGGMILFVHARWAVEGYEDELGFHFGVTPPIFALYPALSASAFAPAELNRAAVPEVPQRRRKSGSKPPMLPANLQAEDLKPRPVRATPKQSPADSGQTQIPFPLDPPSAT